MSVLPSKFTQTVSALAVASTATLRARDRSPVVRTGKHTSRSSYLQGGYKNIIRDLPAFQSYNRNYSLPSNFIPPSK